MKNQKLGCRSKRRHGTQGEVFTERLTTVAKTPDGGTQDESSVIPDMGWFCPAGTPYTQATQLNLSSSPKLSSHVQPQQQKGRWNRGVLPLCMRRPQCLL